MADLDQQEEVSSDYQPGLFGDVLYSLPRAEPLNYERPRVFAVNQIQCYRFSALVSQLVAARASSDTFALSHLPPVEQIRALGHVVGICDRLNWDFALGHLARELWLLSDGFAPAALRRLDPSRFRGAFGSYRREDGPIGYSQRLQKLNRIADYFEHNCVPEQLHAARFVAGERGAMGLLQRCPVYGDDPLHKKCNALLHELARRGLSDFSDTNSIRPAVDYHILRLYLRTGRVEVLDLSVKERLLRREPARIELLTDLRQATADAMIYTAWIARISLSVLNDVEWAFTRQACRRDEVSCFAGHCILAEVCPSRGLMPTQMLTEPRSMHGHY